MIWTTDIHFTRIAISIPSSLTTHISQTSSDFLLSFSLFLSGHCRLFFYLYRELKDFVA
ncbi:hypothetical protein HanXRQr2_Chr01g0026241 [Helianthus annuus]|uniref:Uncharacterized protein n=1 Tax=Helianthus annuus TaxID=4232 RepID=A0A9K3JXK2_HELAN|nr:hypothetical protein HanXRQr2_Chr01g0026241 [Helianthus annuus]KAJ0957278.1 hypothetical protein HanPSC8_Chr01g0025351 [Helianthus annuus]